jgi:hypothetical protein
MKLIMKFKSFFVEICGRKAQKPISIFVLGMWIGGFFDENQLET